MSQERMEILLNSENLENDIKNMSYEDRVSIFNSDLYIATLITGRLIKSNVKMFNQEESIKVYMNYEEKRSHNRILNSITLKITLLDLPDEILIEEGIRKHRAAFFEAVKDPMKLLRIKDVDEELFLSAIEYLPDEELEKLINSRKYKDYTYTIIRSFHSDEKKMKYLHKIDFYDQPALIVTLSEDNIKKYIEKAKTKSGSIIALLKDEKLKEEYFNYYRKIMPDNEKAKIIASFTDTNKILRYIKDLKSEKSYYIFISRLKYMHPICKSELYTKIVLSLKNQEYIKELLVGTKLPENLELKKALIDKVTNPAYLREVSYYYEHNNELFKYILPKLSQKDIIKYVKDNLEFLSDYHVLLYIKNSNLLFKALRHYQFNIEFNEDMLPIFKIVSEKYDLNLEHLIKLAKVANCSILNQIENDNICKAINLDEENFEKYLKIFDDKNVNGDRNAMFTLLNALLNKKFSIDFPDKVEIFIGTLHDVYYGRVDEAISKIKEVLSNINVEKYNITPLQIINGILKNDEEIIKIYNKMTYEYLTLERNKYVNSCLNETLINATDPVYEINDLIKYMVKNVPIEKLLDIISNYDSYDLSPEEFQLFNNKELLMNILKFKKNPNIGLKDEYKVYLKPLNSLLKKIFSEWNYRVYGYIKIEGLNIQYNLKEANRNSLVEIMSNLDVDKLKELIFTNPEVYSELLEYLDTYDALGWSNKYDKLSEQADVEMSSSVVASLISNFDIISKQKKEKISKGERFTFISELTLADCLDSDASIYSILFGRDDYRLLRRNPGPNASPKNKKYRFEKALKCLNIMHSRKYITVPPVNKDFKLKSGKSINIIIGNTNDPINLTYGERTGACMRIGGAGSSLFDFCLKNENGFHISFNNPNTGELISRVSCYRNGNTVFLNQLRYSLDPDYTNEMLKEACTLIGKEIIQNTKDSKFPVLNVVTTDCYAYSRTNTVKTNCTNPTRGFIPSFYTDMSEKMVVVATSEGDLSPIKLGPDKAEKYEVGRAPIRKYDVVKANNAVARIEALDAYYSNVAIDDIDIKKRDIAFAYVGEDWYVALTKDNEVINYVQKNSRNPKVALEEMTKYLNIVKEMITYPSLEENKVIR